MAFQIPINSHNFTGLHAGDAAATTWIQTNHWDTSYDGLGTPQESAWYWDTVTGFEKVWDGAMWVVRGAVSGTTLDMAYDGGGAGLGRSITADSGAVDISVPIAVNGTALAVHQLNPAATVDVFTVENLGASGASIGLTGTRRWIESDAGDATFGLVANDANTYTLHLSAVNTGAGIAKIGIGADDDVDITSDTGCVTIHGYDTGTVGVEIEAVAGGGSVNIGAVNLPNQLNLGTGGIRTVVLGSVTGAAITTLRSGTGAFTVTAGGTFDVNVTGAVTIDAAGASGITIGGDANTGAIGVGNSASARSVTVGSTNTTSALALQAGTGFISFADGYKAAGGYAGALYLALNAAEYTSFEANFGEVSLLNAINQCATSAVTLDEAYNASGGASAITVDAGDVTWALTGAYSFVVDLTAATGTADGFHVEDGTDYFRLNHTAANSLALSSEFTSVGINTSEGVTIRANHASEFRVTSNNLTLSTVTSGTLAVTSAATLDLNAVAATLDASGGYSIDGSGASCNVSATGQALTVSTLSSGTLGVQAVALLDIDAGANLDCDITGTIDIDASGAVTIDSTGGSISVGGGADAQAISIGTGAAARTITIGNGTTTTGISLRSGSGGVDVWRGGNLTQTTDLFSITNTCNAASMTATGTGLLWNQWYYDVATPALADSGRIAVITEGNWTSDAATHDAAMSFQVALNGTLTERLALSSAGVLSGPTSIGVTGTRIAAGFFTDLTVTNAITGSITGNAATVTVADTVSATCYVGLYEAASGSLAGKTDAALTYNASTGALAATSLGVTGAVTGATSTWTTAGTAKAFTDMLTLTNTGNAVDMDGTGVGILWNLYYYDAATPAVWDAGRIVVAAEQDATSTASTQDSYMALYTSLDGTNAERLRVTSAGHVGVNDVAPTSYLSIIAEGVSNCLNVAGGTVSHGDKPAIVRLINAATTISAESPIGKIEFYSSDASGGGAGVTSYIYGIQQTTSPNNGALTFGTGATTAAERLRLDVLGNLGLGLTAWGTSAAKVLGLASGTAPTTSPTNAVQMWAGDFNAAAGKSALHLRDESGVLSVLGNNWGLFTAGAEVIDATAEKTIFLSNGTAPSAHTDDGIYIHSLNCGAYDSADDLASLALCTESAVITASKAQDSALAITINGHSYWMLLRACEAA